MAKGWFRKQKRPEDELPEGLWIQCESPKCRELLFVREWERNLKVCRKCGYHFRLTAAERVDLLADPESFVERDTDIVPRNPLDFPKYSESLTRYQQATGRNDAILSGEARLEGRPFTLAITEARFMMGSMGSVVGERLTRSVERATELGAPAVLVSGTGGGARMQEGILALMQMAKTSGAIAQHHRAGLLTVVVLTDPSMAGVLASWASLGDVILAEPGAMIGFVGQRVSKQANVSKVPTDFQTAEFQLAHGQVDRVVPRKDLRATLGTLFAFAAG
jgi:acetyl-CoA carboxylase carboxyl transferase subunit beta